MPIWSAVAVDRRLFQPGPLVLRLLNQSGFHEPLLYDLRFGGDDKNLLYTGGIAGQQFQPARSEILHSDAMVSGAAAGTDPPRIDLGDVRALGHGLKNGR